MPSLTAIVPATNRPAELARCVDAIRSAQDPPEEVVVVEEPRDLGPAAARNMGVSRAGGEVLVFVDADVVVHPDAFTRIRSAFDRDSELTAIFGSYDAAPEAPGTVAVFRNLLHHHVHQGSPGPAQTFWAGLGAVRRDDFVAVGGFDEGFDLPSIEDVEFGIRLARAGGKLVLDPSLLGTHLKSWNLWQMISTDFARRGVPWVRMLLRSRGGASSAVLNLGWRHRLSAIASLAVVTGLITRRPALSAGAGLSLVALNRSFYALLARRGAASAVTGVGLHVIHHLTAVAAVPAGLALELLENGRAALRRRRARRRADCRRPRPLPGTRPRCSRTTRRSRFRRAC